MAGGQALPSHCSVTQHSCGLCAQGAWRPSLGIATVLASIQLLMSEPNPDDPLMADIVSVPVPSLDLQPCQ